VATKKQEVRTYDEEFAQAAAADAARAAKLSSGSRFFGTAGGTLTYEGAAVPNNQIDAIILDWTPENAFYEGSYDAKNPVSPVCFALEDEGEMVPHPQSMKPQHSDCGTCPHNAWGSAVGTDGGPRPGKRCKNARRLMLVSAENLSDGPIVGLRVPPTSLKAFDGYIKSVSHAMRRPCFGVKTRIRLERDGASFNVLFESLGAVDNREVNEILRRREEAQAPLYAPYEPVAAKPAAKPAATTTKKRGGAF
jgi:hypothetical protein